MAKFSSNSSNTSSDFFIDEGSDAIEYLAGGSVDLSCESNKDDECEVEDDPDDDDWGDDEYEVEDLEYYDWGDDAEASIRKSLIFAWYDPTVRRFFGDFESAVRYLVVCSCHRHIR